jgi:regulator of sigma E protease
VVILAGPASNILLAMVLFAVVFMIAGGKATRTVADVLPNHPAQSMGLRAGDTILAINSRPVTPGQIVDRISSSQGRPLTVTVRRDGQVLDLGPAVPRKDQGVYRLGFRLRGAPLALPDAVWESVKLTGVVTKETVISLGRIVHKQGRKQISSPVGIVKESSVQARYGWQYFLLVEAFISLSLGLVNLLPLLPLDGGHIAFSLVEGLRGRAVTRQVYERASAVGWAFVLLLLFIGLSNDVGRLGGG